MSKAKKKVETRQRRKQRREDIMGKHAATLQDMRATKATAKAAVTKGDSMDKARTRQAVKRVGEYKRGKLDEGFYKGDPKNLEKKACGGRVKKASGGQLKVRGCGAATRGKYLKRNG